MASMVTRAMRCVFCVNQQRTHKTPLPHSQPHNLKIKGMTTNNNTKYGKVGHGTYLGIMLEAVDRDDHETNEHATEN
jgi:hypothetical protein